MLNSFVRWARPVRAGCKRLGQCLLAVTLTLSGVGASAQAQAPSQPMKGAIVVMDLAQNQFQISMANLAVQFGKEMGADVKRYAPEGSFGDYAGQISIIENLITQKVDFIVLVAGHPKALIPVVDKAMKAGIGVVNMDNRMDTTNLVSFVGFDNGAGGKMGADFLAERLGGMGKVALIMGETGNPVQNLRTKGFELGALVNAGLNVVGKQGSKWTEDHGQQVMSDILQAHPDLQGVFCESDNLAIGAIRAATAAKSKALIVGFDGQPAAYKAIKEGTMTATVAMDAEVMVRTALRQAVQYVRQGRKKDGIPSQTLLVPQLVTRANVDKFIK